MMRSDLAICAGVVAATLAMPARALAHHGPWEIVEALSQRIAAGERTVLLFSQRGDEYRAVGRIEAAVADYQSALELQPDHLPALYGLARAHLAQHQSRLAQTVARRGIAASADSDEAATFYAILAQAHEQQQDWESARQAWHESLTSTRPQVDWFLGEAGALERLGRPREAQEALARARRRNPSVVLQRAWLAGLIRCGETTEAAGYIDAGLVRARWKSSWLLLRARLWLAEGEKHRARDDAAAALAEIDGRLNPRRPNPLLAADRAAAIDLLQRAASAARDRSPDKTSS